MKLVVIDLKEEPDCLNKLYLENKNYIALKGDCRKAVIDSLSVSQKGYCAYCEQKLSANRPMAIEHYIPRSVNENLELAYSNFLGVCSGKFYLNKMTGNHIEHCDTSKKSIELRINPKLESHISELFYEDDATIRSKNAQHDEDLSDTLNLNFKEFKQKRNDEFNRNFLNIRDIALKMGLSKKESFERAIQSLEKGKSEFNSYLRFRYTKFVNAEI